MQRQTHITESTRSTTAGWLAIVVLGTFALTPQLTYNHIYAEAAQDPAALGLSKDTSASHMARLIFAPPTDTKELIDPWLRAELPPRTGSAFAQDRDPPQIRGTDRQTRFGAIIRKTSERYAIDPAWIKAIIMVESSYDPTAVSHKGARGLMQLMPATARELGVADSFDPELNIDGGVRYYRKLLRYFDGDAALALAAYNAGLSRVKQYKGVPPYHATRRYIEKVFHYYEHYKEHSNARP